ncbi:MAG: chromate transporter, partial [Clostridia bacterium]|nr:chromate transporter [Clostridia bacterium]
MDINALAQASPGAIALNTAMLVGLKVCGVLGMLATMLGSIIPPFFVITGLYYFYDAIKNFTVVSYIMAGMQAGVCGVIISLVIDMWNSTIKQKSVFSVVMLVLSFVITFSLQFFFNISVVIYTVILSAILGVAFSYLSYFYEQKKAKGEDEK